MVADFFWALFNLSADFDRSTTWTLIHFKWGELFVSSWRKINCIRCFFSTSLLNQKRYSWLQVKETPTSLSIFEYLHADWSMLPVLSFCWSGLVHSFPPNKLLQHFMLYCFMNNIINQTYCNFYCHLVMMLLFFLPAVQQTSAFWK